MSLVKTVEMRILADAGDAQAKLDEMDAKAKDLDSKAIKMRFRLDTAEGRAQLDAIKAKAAELGYKDVDIKVRVDKAGRAVADLMALKHEVDSLDRRAVEGGLLNRLIGGAGGGIGGGTGGIGPIPALPLPVLAAAVPAAGALATEVVAVASGFAAAGAGAGAFFALARPAIKALEQDYTALNSAQAAYSKAQEKVALDPSKSNLKAEATALENLRAVRRGMTQDEGTAAGGISRLSGEYRKLTAAFAPTVFKVAGDGLKVMDNLLPHLTQFAKPFADSLDGLFRQLDKFTQSKGFSDFMAKFSSLTGPATTAIGQGIGKVAGSVGKLLTIFSGKDVAHAINIAFGGISGTINGAAYAIRRFRDNWDGMSRAFGAVRHFFASGGHDLAQDFDQARHAVASIGHDIAHVFDGVRHSLPDVGHFIASSFDISRHQLASAGDAIVSGFKGIPGKIKGIFSGAGGWLTSAGHSMLAGFEHGLSSGWSTVSGWLGGIGGKVKGFFAGAGGWLLGAGRSIIDGLIHGIQSMLGPLEGVVSRAVGIVKSFAGMLGIHSPSTVMHGYGTDIIAGLVQGMKSKDVLIQAASEAAAQSLLIFWRRQRNVLKAEIQQSVQVAQSAISSASIMNAATAGPDPNAQPVSASQVTGGMQYQLSQLKQFTQQVKQLKAEGLNATSLSQIIQAGAGPGSQVAQALLSGGKQAVSQINSLQKQLKAQAAALGDEAAPAMYQAGVQAGQGLANGLKSQMGAISAAIQQLVQDMINQAKKSLKSHSPSLVFAEIGKSIPQGVAVGIDLAGGVAVSASARLAARTVHPWNAAAGAAGGGLHVHFHGITPADKYATAQQVHQVLRDYKRDRGGAALGIG